MDRRWAFLFFALGVLLCVAGQLPESAASESADNSRSIPDAIDVLVQVPTGRSLVVQALKQWNMATPDELTRVLKPGTSSRTDAVLTRRYNPDTGKETRVREITIYVRQNQPIENQVLDIAHEMVHATTRPSFDPYDSTLTAWKYIYNAIEGEGGEVQAVFVECRVATELSRIYGKLSQRCQNYLSGGNIDREKIRADFYRVGKWSKEVARALGPEVKRFPLLSEEAPKLYSSTGNAPYPAALLEEFAALTQIACENSKRRASAFTTAAHAESRESTLEFIERRCQ